jgi:hypothetical protein
VHYVFVPNVPLEKLVLEQALLRARAEVNAVRHSMALEDQASEQATNEEKVRELAEVFIDSRNLWTVPSARK